MELQTNVNYTHQFGGVAPASSAVRLRHSRLRLLNELDVPAAAAGGSGEDDNDGGTAAASSASARQPQGAVDRQGQSSLANRRRREVLAEFRRRAALTLRQRMPVVRDVNKIDRFSRTAFPVLFVVFNVGYWVYYVVEKKT